MRIIVVLLLFEKIKYDEILSKLIISRHVKHFK
jgi:hypothetical protein